MKNLPRIKQELNQLLEIKESLRTERCKELIEEYKFVIELIEYTSWK